MNLLNLLNLLLAATVCLNNQSKTRAEDVSRQKSNCPGKENPCSLHGRCFIDRDGSSVCNCDWGYSGDDCAQRLCPHGFDPTEDVDKGKKYRKIRLMVSDSHPLEGKLLLSFMDHTVEMEAQSTSKQCTESFKRFQAFSQVRCEKKSDTSVYEITIEEYPVRPIMNNLFYHNGNPVITTFSCDVSQTTRSSSVKCNFEDINKDNILEYLPCCNHGKCDSHAGRCTCDEGYYGFNCDDTADHANMLHGASEGIFFTGNVAKLSSQRSLSHDFHFLHANGRDGTVFTIDGAGNTTLHEGSLHILKGNHTVTGSLHINGQGVIEQKTTHASSSPVLHLKRSGQPPVSPSALITPVLLLELDNNHSTTSHSTSSRDAKVATEAAAVPFLRMTRDGKTMCDIDGTGQLTLHEGGGGLTVESVEGINVSVGDLNVRHGHVHFGKDRGNTNVINDPHPLIEQQQPFTLTVMGGTSISREATSSSTEDTENTDVSSSSYPALNLHASGSSFTGAVLNISTTSAENAWLLQGWDDTSRVFGIQSSGKTTIDRGGMHINAGGLVVNSGGLTVASGGLSVTSGGINITSGGLVIAKEGFTIENGGLVVTNEADTAPSLHVVASSPHFEGAALLVEKKSADKTHGATSVLMDARVANHSVWRLHSDGSMMVTSGSLIRRGGGPEARTVEGTELQLEGRLITVPHLLHILSDNSVTLSCRHMYQTLSIATSPSSLPSSSLIHLRMETNETWCRGGIAPGHLLMLQNNLNETLSGLDGITVHANSVTLLIFDGKAWKLVSSSASTLAAPDDLLNDNDTVAELEAQARRLVAAGQLQHHVSYYGKDGSLSGSRAFTYTESTQRLAVPSLQADEIIGQVNMNAAELRNVRILAGELVDVNIRANVLVGNGELHLASHATIGGQLIVAGQVMGSGAYLDSSDIRFKMHIRPISGHYRSSSSHHHTKGIIHPNTTTTDQTARRSSCLPLIRQLQGVEYNLRVNDFPTRHFSNASQLGFIANDVELVLPQLVTTDSHGYKQIAYARLLPVVVEGMKESDMMIQQLQQTNSRLAAELSKLKQKVLELSHAVDQILTRMDMAVVETASVAAKEMS